MQLKGVRREANDFFRPPTLSLFRAMIITPEKGGGHKPHYVNVFSFDTSSHTSNKGVPSLQCAVDYAATNNLICKRQSEMAFYSDKAKHFCSGEMAYGLLFEVSKHVADASYTYHACYRGKTPLDAHFARLKEKIGKVAVEK